MKKNSQNLGPKTVFRVTDNDIVDRNGDAVRKIGGHLVSCQAFSNKNIFELRFVNDTCGWFAVRVNTKSRAGRAVLLSLAGQATLGPGEIIISFVDSEVRVALVRGTSATLLPQASYPAGRDLRLLEPVIRGILIGDLYDTFTPDIPEVFDFLYDSISGRDFLLLQGSEIQKKSKRELKRELSRVF